MRFAGFKWFLVCGDDAGECGGRGERDWETINQKTSNLTAQEISNFLLNN